MPQRFLDAVRNPPTITTRVEVWRGGTRVDPYGDRGLTVYGGQSTDNAAKQVRRTLTGAKVDANDATWDLLSPAGTELRVWRGFTYLNGETDLAPVGWFVLDDLEETYGGDWAGQIGSAPDRMVRVQRDRFTVPRSFPAGMRIVDAIATLLTETLGLVTVLTTNAATFDTAKVFERDRAGAIGEMAKSIGVDVFIAADGTPTVTDLPQLAAEPVWTVDAGDQGVLYTATRGRSLAGVYTGVTAVGKQIDGAPPFAPVTVWDADPLSPTYYLGPLGKVPYFMTSDLFRNAEQALYAATTRLPLVTAPRAQFTVDAECNPALASGDTIRVSLPPRQRGQQPVIERHLTRVITTPLGPDGTQTIETASAVADVEDSE